MPPQQGQPRRKKGRGCLIALAVIAVLIAIGAISNWGSGPATTTPAGAPNQGQPTNKAAAGLNTPVTDGDLEFVVTDWKCGVTVTDITEDPIKPQGQFCRMGLTAKNTGKSQVKLDQDSFKVKDANGAEYKTSMDTLFVDGIIFLKDINPGNKLQGVAYFDVPVDANVTTAVLEGGLFSSGAMIKLA